MRKHLYFKTDFMQHLNSRIGTSIKINTLAPQLRHHAVSRGQNNLQIQPPLIAAIEVVVFAS